MSVAEIAENAGLTRRTFFRYFADKRDVLFAGSEELPPALAAAVMRVDPAVPPFQAVLDAMCEVGALLVERMPHSALRRAVIATSPELQERERTKFAAVTEAIADALKERGVNRQERELLARAGVVVFQSAFDRWIDEPKPATLSALIGDVAAQLASNVKAPHPRRRSESARTSDLAP